MGAHLAWLLIRRLRMRWPRCLAYASLYAWGAMAQIPTSAVSDGSWWVVTPHVLAPGHREEFSALFTRHLRAQGLTGVQLHAPTRNRQVQALEWALQHAPRHKSLVLWHEEFALVGDAAIGHPRHLQHYAPLLVMLETQWCLFTWQDAPIQRAEDLLNWARQAQRAPVVALPVLSGRMRLWVQGMAVRSHRSWEMVDYGLSGDPSVALRNGADVALGRCDLQWAHAASSRVLARSNPLPGQKASQIPLFSDVGWMPLGNGWLAWMAPRAIAETERSAMAQALYRVLHMPEVQAEIRATGLMPINLTPEQSQYYIERYSTTWNQIGALMLGSRFGDLDAMASPAKP